MSWQLERCFHCLWNIFDPIKISATQLKYLVLSLKKSAFAFGDKQYAFLFGLSCFYSVLHIYMMVYYKLPERLQKSPNRVSHYVIHCLEIEKHKQNH